MKVGREMTSAYENYLLQKFTWKLTKVTFFPRNLRKIFRGKQYIGVGYSYIT